MTGEELEISITQYLDGTLPPEKRAALESVLATDESARALLEEHQQLDAAIRSAMPIPQINWESLSRKISNAVADAEAPATTVYTINWRRPAAWLAAAACLLIACGVAMQLLRSETSPTNPVNPSPTVTRVAQVSGPQIEQPGGPEVAEFALGPAPVAAMGNDSAADGVVVQPSDVSIASGISFWRTVDASVMIQIMMTRGCDRLNPIMHRIAIVIALVLLVAAPAFSQQTSALVGEALDKQITKLDLDGTLVNAIVQISNQTGVRIEPDSAVYDVLPWGDQTTFTAKFENQTLRQVLSAISQKLGLRFELGREAVLLHPLPALRRMGRRATVDELKELDMLATTPLGLDSTTPSAEQLLQAIDGKLDSLKSPYNLENRAFSGDDAKTVINVARNVTLLEALEEIPAQTNSTWYPWGKSVVVLKKTDQIHMQLSQHMTTRFDGVDVSQALLDLSERSGVNFEIEPGAVQRIPTEFRNIKLAINGATIQQALETISGFTGLGYVITDKGVYVWNPSPGLPNTSTQPAK